jgi:hypothetical protein
MRFSSSLLLAMAPLFVAAACESPPKGRDAAAQSKVAEMTVRVDAPNDGTPSISVLGFRATVTGGGSDDVRAVVDPLLGPAPEGGCMLRDVAGPARALAARGGTVELDALAGLGVDLGDDLPVLRLAPRVYPDLAAVVGGVVGEAAPVAISAAPDSLTVTDGLNGHELVPVPELPRLLDAEGNALPASTALPSRTDLVLGVPGALSTFVELRPFGATWALACPVQQVEAQRQVVIPAVEIARLVQRSGRVPVSVEAVARDERWLSLAGGPLRLTLEVRSSSVVELRP